MILQIKFILLQSKEDKIKVILDLHLTSFIKFRFQMLIRLLFFLDLEFLFKIVKFSQNLYLKLSSKLHFHLLTFEFVFINLLFKNHPNLLQSAFYHSFAKLISLSHLILQEFCDCIYLLTFHIFGYIFHKKFQGFSILKLYDLTHFEV